MQASTAIAIVIAPAVWGVVRWVMRPVNGLVQRRVTNARLRRILLLRVGGK